MQLILTENDYEQIYFETKRTDYSPGSFVCPFCNKNGFSEQKRWISGLCRRKKHFILLIEERYLIIHWFSQRREEMSKIGK